jgi:surface antigen
MMLMLRWKVMKHGSTTPVSRGFAAKSVLVAVAVLMAIAAPLAAMPRVKADKYDDQINALKQEVSNYQAQASILSAQANTLKNQLADLSAQKATIETQLQLSQAKYDKLISDIAATEKRITDNKDALGKTIADMYVDDTVSPLEMLASSKNIGDYVDKQTYQSSIQDQLTQTIAKINDLKAQLEVQKKSVEHVIADQKSQKNALIAKEGEQNALLTDTQGQESSYQALSAQRNQQINSLRAAQAAAMAAAAQASGASYIGSGSLGGGGYPSSWADSTQDTIIDNWGLYNRECVSYTAWKVASTGRFVPNFGGAGNANQWPSTAASYGIPNGTTPKPGSVAIWYIGAYGHAMYVEGVNSADGTITVSDYNNNTDGGGWGRYHYYVRSSAGLTYIYF